MFPTLLEIGPITIRTYGFFIAVGLFVALQYMLRRAKQKNIPENVILDVVLYAIVSGLVGARLVYVLTNWPYYASHPGEIVKVWEGGLVFYGGFVAGVLAVLVYFYFNRTVKLWVFADLAAPALALGHFFGRIGCFFAGCCYGLPSHLPWAVKYCNPQSLAPLDMPRHPTQLYEALGNLVIFLLLDWYNKSRHPRGYTFAAYLFFYSLMRFSVEFLRADDRGASLLGLSQAQAISLVIMIVSIVFMWRHRYDDSY